MNDFISIDKESVLMRGKMPLSVQNANGENHDPVSKEAERFENFYQGILELHEVLERVENFTVRRRMREIISRVEGRCSACLGHFLECKEKFSFIIRVIC